jgi:hypothetical protein
MELEFSQEISEKSINVSNSIKTRPVGVELLRADGHDEVSNCRF